MKSFDSKTFNERLYQNNSWWFLKNIEERSRYAVVAAYANYLKRNPIVLDVGCGEGILAEFLNYEKYEGIDISPTAILDARKKKIKGAKLMAIDLIHYDSTRKFDVIIFNEILYLLNDCFTVNKYDYKNILTRFSKFLKKNGTVVVSMIDHPKTNGIWKYVKKKFRLIDQTKVTNLRELVGWNIGLLTLK